MKGPEIAVGAALCGRPSPIMGRFPGHPVGEGLAPPAMSRDWPWIAVGAGPRPARPPRTMTSVGRAVLQGFALRGDLLCPRRQRRQNAAGGDSHRRREQVPSGSSSFSPGPPFTGDTPTPFRKISGAQNMVPGMIPSGPPGPGAVQNFGLCYFPAAPGSDQPW